jgi:hypothetical protein
MPYDPRPVSEGGNKGIDECFSRQAPTGKFRVIGVDTFDGSDWVQGDCDTLAEARELANKKGGEMTMMHIYNDQGKHMGNAGIF